MTTTSGSASANGRSRTARQTSGRTSVIEKTLDKRWNRTRVGAGERRLCQVTLSELLALEWALSLKKRHSAPT